MARTDGARERGRFGDPNDDHNAVTYGDSFRYGAQSLQGPAGHRGAHQRSRAAGVGDLPVLPARVV